MYAIGSQLTCHQFNLAFVRDHGQAGIQLFGKFGAGAVSTLVSGTYSLVKDGVISLATKNVSDLVAAMATGLILTYSDFSPTTTAVTTFLVQQLARKAVSVARAELAKKAQPLSDAAAAKLQTIAYGIYATQLGLKEQQ